jgi:hypothetical protein
MRRETHALHAPSRIASEVLHRFAWRMAVRALRVKTREPLMLGLTSVSIEDTKSDMRETLMYLSLLCHAGVRTNADVESCFRDAAAISTEPTGELILAFLDRPVELRSIDVFGFREGSSEDGPTLLQTPFN